MSHPLEARVRAVEQRARRLRWCYGWSWFFLVAAGLVCAASLVDYALRLHDPGLRWMLSLALAAGLAWSLWRFVLPARGNRRSLVPVAQRIERHFPALEGRLSSAIAFLSQAVDEPTAGSIDLRRAVVAEAEALSLEMNFQDVLNARHSRRLLALAGMAAIAALAVTLIAPSLVGLGLIRLVNPAGSQTWPARHALEFAQAPHVLATGDDFEVELIDRRGELPATVELTIRRAAGGRDETHAMKRLGDRMVFRLDNVTQPFSYRAVGGDDYSMAWKNLDVVSPPRITELVMEVSPPPYTGWPVQQGRQLVRALAGSKLAMRGTVDRPIRSATLKSGSGQTLPVRVAIADDARSFSAPADSTPWLAEKGGEVWCEVTDESGLPAGRQDRIELQVVADAPPTISWESPTDHMFVTRRALVPIRGLIKDDLAVARVELRYLRPDASDLGEQSVALYAGPDPAGPQEAENALQGVGGHSLPLSAAWDLALIPGLAEGSVLTVRVIAEDFKPQQTAAVARRLTVVSDIEMENRVVLQQSSVLSQMAEALRLQREAREQTAELEIKLGEQGRLTVSDLSHLQSAELNQRQVQRLLVNPQDGVESRIVALLEELTNNRVSSQMAADRLRQLLAKVRELASQELSSISHDLTTAIKSGQAVEDRPPCGDDEDAVAGRSLKSAGLAQERVIGTLESLLGDLSQFDSFSRLAREVGQMAVDQRGIASESDQLRLEMAIDDAMDRAAQRATSRLLSRRQLDLTRRFEKLQSRMDVMRKDEADPLMSAALTEALDSARRQAIAGRMRSAAANLQEVKPGPAHRTQLEVQGALDELLDILSRRRDLELGRTAQSLRAAASELGALAQRQQQLQGELADATQDPQVNSRQRKLERLSRPVQQLAEEVRELARRLQRLQARRAGSAGEQAAIALDQAGNAAAAAEGEQAERHASQAQDLLEETRRELQQQIQQAEQDLLREQLARFEQHVEGLILRQKNVIQETERLADLRGQQSGLTAAQQATLRSLADEQRLLAQETQQLQTTVQNLPAFVLGLQGIRESMLSSAERLAAQDIGPAAAAAQNEALRRLLQLRESLASDEESRQDSQPSDDQPPSPAPNGPPPPVPNLAELKLLKLMQQSIQTQTTELETLRAQAGELNPEQLRRLESLAREQGILADMVMDMVEATADHPEDAVPMAESTEKNQSQGDKGKGKPLSLDEELLKELEKK